MKETHSDGSRGHKTFALDRQIEPLVMDSEIAGLEDKHAFLKLGNSVARFSFDYLDLPTPTPAFVPRRLEDDELCFDPLTLTPKARPLPVLAAAAPPEEEFPMDEEELEEFPLEPEGDTDSPVDMEADDEPSTVPVASIPAAAFVPLPTIQNAEL